VDLEPSSSGRSVGLLERHYSDESSKRADSDSHAESIWTDQERESDTPTVSTSTQCPLPPPASTASTAHPTNETKVNICFPLWTSFLFPSPPTFFPLIFLISLLNKTKMKWNEMGNKNNNNNKQKDGQQRLSRLFNRPANSSTYSSSKKSLQQHQQQQLANVTSSSSVFSLSSKDQKSIESTVSRDDWRLLSVQFVFRWLPTAKNTTQS